ncbi:MAG TPA: hypothetical protein VJK02_19240 [Anaerolineales bacterium]|nr:hypothetical protein [Anaerolineales bacterium]
MYPWLVYLHLLGLFGILLAHGASSSASFALQRERDPERIRALLELSANSYGAMYVSILVLLASGITAGVIGHWWSQTWIRASLILLIVIMGAMNGLGSRVYGEVRKATGLPYFEGVKQRPPIEPANKDRISAILSRGNPVLLTLIGYGGLAAVAWLMMFKPF